MKRLLIAGYSDTTVNYQTAFGQLNAAFDTFPIKSTENTPPLSHLFYSPFDYDGLVLPGGGDIAPALFNAANKGSRNIDEPLDRLQLRILDIFLKNEKPVLGICKGLQLLNVYFGGTIIQDLPEDSQLVHAYSLTDHVPMSQRGIHKGVPNGDKIHPTKAAGGTFLEKLYGSAPVTNSAHHQGIGTVGDGLFVSQYSHDFVIEAMYHEKLPVIGVQWHPERMCFSFTDVRVHDGAILLRYFLSLL